MSHLPVPTILSSSLQNQQSSPTPSSGKHIYFNFFASENPHILSGKTQKMLHSAAYPHALKSASSTTTTTRHNNNGGAGGNGGGGGGSGSERHHVVKRMAYTALHQSIVDCRLQQVHLLITKCGADVNAQDVFGRTPLILCCLMDDVKLARKMAAILLKASFVDMDLRDNLGRSALAYACIMNRVGLGLTLLNGESDDFSDADHDGNTPLHHAAIHGISLTILSKLVDTFLRFDVDIDLRNRLGYSPLILAIRNRHFSTALYLLCKGKASPDVRENEYFLNAKEWYSKVYSSIKKQQLQIQPQRPGHSSGGGGGSGVGGHSSEVYSRRTTGRERSGVVGEHGTNVSSIGDNSNIRPRLVHERTNTTLNSFYKELMNPVLRDSMLQSEFQSLASLSLLPVLSRERSNFNNSHSQFPLSVEEFDSHLKDNEPPPNFDTDLIMDPSLIGSLSLERIHACLRAWLYKPPAPVVTPSNPVEIVKIPSPKSKGKKVMKTSALVAAAMAAAAAESQQQTTKTKFRPNTAQLMPYRVMSSCSSAETVRRLLNAYSNSVNAPPPARAQLHHLKNHHEKKFFVVQNSPKSSRRASLTLSNIVEERRGSTSKK